MVSPIWIPIHTRPSLFFPITWQRLVRGVLPVVEDLVDYLGDVLLSSYLSSPLSSEGRAIEVGIGDFALRDGDARVLVEDVDEGEEVGDEVVEDEQDGDGDDGDSER